MRTTPRRILTPLLVAVATLGLLAAPGAGSASGTTHERIAAALSLRISAATAAPGASLLVSGTGFSSGERVDLYVGVRSAGAVTAGSDGSFTGARFSVPTATPPGSVPVLANGRYSRFTAQSELVVQSSWGQSGRDARHTNANPDENVVGTANVGQLAREPLVGLDVQATSLVVASGSTFLAERSAVEALPVAVGGPRWTHPDVNVQSNNGVVATPTRVFYRSGSELQALDARTGKGVWRTEFWRYGNGTAPVAFSYADGALYVLTEDTYQSRDIYRFAPADGTMQWGVGGDETYGPATPAVADGVVYLRRADGGVGARDAATGQRLWSTPLPNAVTRPVAVSGDSLVAPSSSNLVVLDRATGRVRWASSGGTYSDVAVTGNRVICSCYSFTAGSEQLTAFDLTSGAVLWSYPDAGGTPTVANGVVYVAALVALDAASGARLAAFSLPTNPSGTGEGAVGPAVVVDGVILVPTVFTGSEGQIEQYGIERYALPDRDGVPAVRSVDDAVTGSGDGQFRYAGGWVAGSRPGAFGDTFHYARSTGATASVTFTGVGARVWYSTAPGFGKVTVSLDGSVVATLDQGSPVKRDGVKSWTSGVLGRGPHTLAVRSLGTAVVDVDRIDLGTS